MTKTTSDRRVETAAAAAPLAAPIPIRDLNADFRPRIEAHLLALEPRARYLRFGYTATDAQIRAYAAGIDFKRDRVFGIFDRDLDIVAMAHLAFENGKGTARTAEFGVSVAKDFRRQGYGTQLFTRAAVYAINSGVDTLYIHALNENQGMLCIARKAKATIERSGSEADALVHLPKANPLTQLNQTLSEQVADVDYWLKSSGSSLHDVLAAMHQPGGKDTSHGPLRGAR